MKKLLPPLPIIALVIGLGLWPFLSAGTVSRAVSADALNTVTSCPQTQRVSYSGRISVTTDRYDVYVRLPAKGQLAGVSVYYQKGLDDDCRAVGTVTASGDTWTKAGAVADLDSSTPAVFQLSSDQLGDTLDANRPSVMLVSQTYPACTPTTECYVTVDGKQGYVRPPGSLPNESSLHIVQAIDPAQDTLTVVKNYVDDVPVYTTATLKPFDLRYASGPNQSLTQVLTYESGQLVVLTSQAPATYTPGLGDVVFRLFLSHSLLTWLYVIGVIIVVAAVIAVQAIRIHKHNYRWQARYKDMQHYSQYLGLNDQQRTREDGRRRRLIILQGTLVAAGLGSAALLLIVTINTFGATLYAVDGHSMESTLHDGQEVFVNKLPVTTARLGGVQYVPPRGSVVILRAVYGIGESETLAPESYIIKRVIGLPGERVVVKDGSLLVYNADHPSGFQPDQGAPWQPTMHANDPHETIDVTLAADELFVSGDNRPVSIDSRFNGPIRTNEVIGVVSFKIL